MFNIDELLISLGINRFHAVLATIVLALVNLIGALLCLLSTWIFFQARFNTNPLFIYYRILCVTHVIHLMQGVPYGLFYLPWFLPSINSYAFSFYHCYYVCMEVFLVHFEDVIQMAILVDRMKIFSPRVKRYFSASPRFISVCIGVVCLLINLPNFFAFKIDSIGSYSLENNQNATLYFLVSSNFSSTLEGRVLFGFLMFFLNIFLSLLLGVILNIVAYAQYKSYLRYKHTQPQIDIQVIDETRKESTNPKKRKIENNLFMMSLSLCSLVIISRTIHMFVFVYFFFFYSYNNNVLVAIITFAILSFVPAISIAVFYFYNKMFRKELNQKIKIFLKIK